MAVKIRNFTFFKIMALVFTVIIGTLSFSSCGEAEKESGKLTVVTTLFPQYDFARAIGGDRIEITKLLPWGSESHTYDPSIRDISEVTNADVFLYTGEDLERWTSSIVEAAEESDCRIADLSSNITLLESMGDGEHSHGENSHSMDYDTHIWTSPENAKIMAEDILAVLCELDYENAQYYRENAEKLIAELAELSEQYSELSEKYDGRTLYFGGRFAFLYMFDHYGFSYRSPYHGCGEESEPSIRTITEICADIKADGAKYVFYEEMSEGKIAKSIAEETGAMAVLLHSCHNLTYDDAMSGKTYISVMRENLEALRAAVEQ